LGPAWTTTTGLLWFCSRRAKVGRLNGIDFLRLVEETSIYQKMGADRRAKKKLSLSKDKSSKTALFSSAILPMKKGHRAQQRMGKVFARR